MPPSVPPPAGRPVPALEVSSSSPAAASLPPALPVAGGRPPVEVSHPGVACCPAGEAAVVGSPPAGELRSAELAGLDAAGLWLEELCFDVP